VTATTLLRKATKAAVLPVGLVTRGHGDDVVVLLYHRVGDGMSEIELAPEALERQLEALSSARTVVTLEAALSGAPGVVVTFDDGTPDFLDRVVPALVRHGVPAVLYLATGMVAGQDGAPVGALSWAGLGEAVASGIVTVGSHTHGHVDLSSADEPTAAAEMRRSRDLIEDHLGIECRHFAYPWAVGGPAADAVARQLFDSAALDAWRTNRVGFDPHRLGRVPILRSDGQFFFRRKVAGQLDSEAFIYKALGRGPWGRS
jgi:peptidoglycan/xylan/chitin deacetylase (PgdA/CDA1 family)